MNAEDSLPIGQHDVEIQANRRAWQSKAQLRAVYRGFHELIASRLDRSVPGLVVELGSGMGSIKEVIPDCVTTDLFPNPWLDRQENAYRLSFAAGSVSNLILFDVWHHLRYPGTALAERLAAASPVSSRKRASYASSAGAQDASLAIAVARAASSAVGWR